MNTNIEQAKVAVRDAQGNYDRLCRAYEMLGPQLAQAEQALNAARFKLARATQEAGFAGQRENEIAALTAALNDAKGNRHV
ncbi:hypothetical protein HP546_19025 [Pseudomonas sp. CM25]|uniref:hypothetical protein n=1 Tax=Pseudomonas sp. CM25 TaxID=2738448 RepID=UPI0015519530|nr:hypothetical protein [Pseudomonas sp. CM25]NQD57432.1 hypothetical protein [Pseudomonas sp. CM25]